MMRNCSKCGSETNFAPDYPSRRGYWCKPCKSAYNVENAKKNRETKRKNNNAWHSRNSANRANATRLYRAANPEKKAAHQAVQTALRNGSLKKGVCEFCGSSAVHAHHDDYLQPLSVRWMCHTHHMEHHMLEARK